MLHDFIRTNREILIARILARAEARPGPGSSGDDLKNGVPVLLDQIVDALRLSPPSAETLEAIGESAKVQGRNLRELGLTAGQVIHGYGDVCQAVTALACEADVSIAVDDFATFNRCLDDAMAEAMTAFTR